jgi:hypothetical protein
MQVREKNSTIFFFSKLIVPILYLAMETPKIVFLEKLFSTTFITKVCVFLVQIFKFVKEKEQFCFLSKRIAPIISLAWEIPKVVVLEKKIFAKFCNESSCFSCSNMQVRLGKTPFSFFRNEWSQSFSYGKETPNLCCRKTFFDVFLVLICKFAKK